MHNYETITAPFDGVVSKRYAAMQPTKRKISEYMRENIHVTSSGMAWAPVIEFCQRVLGADRVMYAMDYPYQYNAAEVLVTDEMQVSDADKKKFYQTNAERIFNLT